MDIIIPTSKKLEDSHYSLFYTIKSLLNQNCLPNKIIVVQNAPEIGLEALVNKEFGGVVEIIDNDLQFFNISHARNIGAQKSTEDIILFMDDDIILGDNNCLSKVADIMEYEDFCCGANRYWTPIDWYNLINKKMAINHIQRIFKAKSDLPLSIDRVTGLQNFYCYSYIGNFGAIKRHIFDKMNGFDESYKGWTYQDTDFMMRLCLSDSSYRLMYDNDISIYHLSHSVDKSLYKPNNRKIFEQKQSDLKTKFHLNHFFGYFGCEKDYSICTPTIEK